MKKTRKVNDKASSIATKPGILAPKQQSRKTPHRLRWIRYVTIFVILAIIAVIVGVNTYSQYVIEREHAKVKTELNEVAYDLHNVYVNLKSTLPNVVESSFKNGCTMSYAGPSTKAYSCGPTLRMYTQNAADSNSGKFWESAMLQTGVFKSYLNTGFGQNSSGYKYSSYQFAHNNGQICKLSIIFYQDKVALQRDTSTLGDSWTFPVEVDDIYCSKHLTYPVELEVPWSQ